MVFLGTFSAQEVFLPSLCPLIIRLQASSNMSNSMQVQPEAKLLAPDATRKMPFLSSSFFETVWVY